MSRHNPLMFVFAFAVIGWVYGCSYNMPLDTATVSEQFPFLRQGETTRQEVLNRMGLPMASYESDRILIFSMIENHSLKRFQVGYDSMPGRAVATALYHLVLVFDSKGRLERHSLVRVQ